VGYGKTEVAMRAAFKAAIDGRQTVLLAPTTLLVNQHFANFSGRMLSFGIKVAMLSRFVPPKRQKEILEEVAAGKVDVIIGTHRLLQKDVSFATLGLVIIDEEQRFGVAHKDKLKKMRETVDVLTLTATPIPRTLYMSISGIRDISVINTPPPERLSIKTFIRKFANETINEAIIRELSRGGQIFFVHNSVKSIGRMLAYLKKLVPGVRADAAHGQMSGTELEEVMERFIRHRTDMLVCTTIIESGLDIPNANTIIINRADRFGLAQLYQLRGRVGRSKHRAYAYMLVPGSLTPLARKRIKAMEELSELGSGFKLAARDMEIRGAGNLLGSQQSGHITAVGFETYCRMLEEAVEELRFGVAERKTETALSLDFVGKLEESYIPVLEQRMNFYYRINRADSKDEIVRIGEELADRFGPPPEKAQKLLSAVLIRLAAIRLGLEKVELSGGFLLLTFPPGSKSIPEVASRGATAFSKRIGTLGESTLKMNLSSLPPGQRPSAVSAFLLQCVAEEKPAISPMGMLPV
jgi:transcription-repair coupling factor (superfamily II helicase)